MRSGHLRRSSTSSSNGGSAIPICTSITTTTMSRRLWIISPNCMRRAKTSSGASWGDLRRAKTRSINLLRGRVFVDLYRVVRQGIRASVESYSLKRLEPLFRFERQVALEDVNEQMVRFEIALDDHAAAADRESQALIQGYNEDDCRSTLGLRDWLEERRLDLEATLNEEIPRPVAPEPQELRLDTEVEALRKALLAGMPEQDRTVEQEARALMADLLEWHRRDAKPGWWRFFHLHDLTDDELLGEPDAIAGLKSKEQSRKSSARTLCAIGSLPRSTHSVRAIKPSTRDLTSSGSSTKSTMLQVPWIFAEAETTRTQIQSS